MYTPGLGNPAGVGNRRAVRGPLFEVDIAGERRTLSRDRQIQIGAKR
jgi:hypothetical protein